MCDVYFIDKLTNKICFALQGVSLYQVTNDSSLVTETHKKTEKRFMEHFIYMLNAYLVVSLTHCFRSCSELKFLKLAFDYRHLFTAIILHISFQCIDTMKVSGEFFFINSIANTKLSIETYNLNGITNNE